MISDLETVIDQVAQFLDIEIDNTIKSRTLHHCSFDYMKSIETKFGEQKKKKPERIYDQFIRKGEVGSGKEMFDTTLAQEFKKSYDDKIAGHALKHFAETKE